MTTFVQHRAVTPEGKVLAVVTLTDCSHWMPYASSMRGYDGEHTLETRVLPGGEWEPAAVVRQPGYQPVVIVRGML
jgi:hypothetical protein